jgi:hypothetical protein
MTVHALLEYKWANVFRFRRNPKVDYEITMDREGQTISLYARRIEYPHNRFGPDLTDILITDAIRHCPYIIVGAAKAANDFYEIPIVLYEPRIALTPAEKCPAQ